MRVKHYNHPTSSGGPMAAIGTSFATAKTITLDSEYWPENANFIGTLRSLVVQVSSIAGGATALSWRLSRDAAADECLITDTSGTIYTGVTTATDGSLSFKLDFLVALVGGGGTFYLTCKTDAGTVTVDEAVLCWEE
tara:strand:+ start:2866 stop:3276 length:411 start_codon:yes stop_codon:yes gene_type:complete